MKTLLILGALALGFAAANTPMNVQPLEVETATTHVPIVARVAALNAAAMPEASKSVAYAAPVAKKASKPLEFVCHNEFLNRVAASASASSKSKSAQGEYGTVQVCEWK